MHIIMLRENVQIQLRHSKILKWNKSDDAGKQKKNHNLIFISAIA